MAMHGMCGSARLETCMASQAVIRRMTLCMARLQHALQAQAWRQLHRPAAPGSMLQVEWDSGTTKGVEKANDCERVSPWELETDPDENLRREEDKKKAAEASKRAARAARGARRA